jgi:small subunit ribosomal protein S4
MILVNGHRVNIPSYIVKAGDIVEVDKNSKNHLRIKTAIEMASNRNFPSWIEVNVKDIKGTYKTRPDRAELPSSINESLVIELYSK